MLFFPACDEFWKFCLVSSLFGVSTGFHVGVYGVMLADILGIHRLHAGYALSMITNG